MKLKEYAVADLMEHRAPQNPRKISDEALTGLEASIARYGLVQPIIVNTTTGNIVGGDKRLLVLHKQGIEKTEVVEVELSADEEIALNLALNNPAIQGEFTGEVAEIITELSAMLPDAIDALRLNALADEVFDYMPMDVGQEKLAHSRYREPTIGEDWVLVYIGDVATVCLPPSYELFKATIEGLYEAEGGEDQKQYMGKLVSEIFTKGCAAVVAERKQND